MEAALGDDRRVLEELGGVVAFEDRLLQIEVGDALVELDGVGHGRFGEGQVVRQHVEVLLDLLGGRTGVVAGVGGDQGDHVAPPEHLLARNDRKLAGAGALLPRHMTLDGHVVGALDVLGGHDLDDARHGLGFSGVDRQDVGVMSLRQHDGEVGDTVGHLQGHVVAVVG